MEIELTGDPNKSKIEIAPNNKQKNVNNFRTYLKYRIAMLQYVAHTFVVIIFDKFAKKQLTYCISIVMIMYNNIKTNPSIIKK